MSEEITPTPRELWPQWLQDADTENAVVTIEDGRVIWLGGTWHDGEWHDGEWRYGTWHDGVWRGGVWHGGHWRDGMWRGGAWLDGEWSGGMWREGYRRGGGTWRTDGPPGVRSVKKED